jgi:hypothetical protein
MAVRQKEYLRASEQFDRAAAYFRQDEEFGILRESTRLLLEVKKELARLGKENELQIEEVFSDG